MSITAYRSHLYLRYGLYQVLPVPRRDVSKTSSRARLRKFSNTKTFHWPILSCEMSFHQESILSSAGGSKGIRSVGDFLWLGQCSESLQLQTINPAEQSTTKGIRSTDLSFLIHQNCWVSIPDWRTSCCLYAGCWLSDAITMQRKERLCTSCDSEHCLQSTDNSVCSCDPSLHSRWPFIPSSCHHSVELSTSYMALKCHISSTVSSQVDISVHKSFPA